MKILVTGINGQLGYDVMKCLKKRKIDCVGAGRQEFDLTDQKAVERFIIDEAPDAVIHCAAYTAVDKAEEEKDLCYKVNVEGTEHIAKICKTLDIKMLYISTDYVFSGTGEEYYEITDQPAPIGYYGKTKFLGEEAVKKWIDKYFIVRISWVFGKNGNNFVKTMLRLGKEREEISVVADQIGSPTYTADLAVLLCDMIETEQYGTYHATNEGVCSWAEFAEEIFRIAKMPVTVKRISSEEYKTKAIRPKNSRLSKSCLEQAGFKRLPKWQDALWRYLEEEF
ncbi:dTDP-4-dehydrorhamnose reductase [Velocimicrobium porci]|uniref:dTDP-4-dehydrorhamnose reductase n=1 Tax=Velocimicrobium porci TaxID=2606634 RepID=A0A6L5Y1J4_9FIRM|nr:dTDP-4-dehydrorhamnose reductase [Velocimicrobium porci]MSS64915.1 dTDP-4-dehydrorhamnose reductase [Velocimicrobium porci]